MKAKPNPTATRADDARLIQMIREREAGIFVTDIAAHYGISKQRVQSMTNAVMDADQAEGGEDLSGDYWARRVQMRRAM